MSIPTPDFLTCPICRTRFNGTNKKPISLLCGHTCCSSCLQLMHRKQCPLDATPFQQEDIDSFPTNQALLLLVDNRTEDNTKALQNGDDCKNDEKVQQCIGELALYLKPLSSVNQKSGNSITLSRPMQRKLVALVHCQLAEPVGRARALRAARSLGERTCTELILQHQNQQQLSSMLWAAVRTRGCQFLGPAMQEAALKYILLSLEQGEALSRKVLVLYVVQQLEQHFPQASKTSIGHVVQLLYRASCFKVAKRNDDSSLMQLKEEYRTYEALRREHDAQIVNMAQEAGIRIPPDQWSQLLYGDTAHKSHMQSIIDRLQTPASFTQSIQELMIALSRTEDPHCLSDLSDDFNALAAINPATEDSSVTWAQLCDALIALRNVVKGLERFLQTKAKTKGLTEHAHTVSCLHDNCTAHGKYKTTMCRDLLLPQSCPRGASCTFAHTQEEMERYRNQKKTVKHMSEMDHVQNGTAECGDRGYNSMSNSPAVAQPQVPLNLQNMQPAQHLGPQCSVAVPPQYPQQNLAPPQSNGHASWPAPDPRLATPRYTTPHSHPSLDAETLQLLQLRQQLLQQGITHDVSAAPRTDHTHFASAPPRCNGLTGLSSSDYFNTIDLHRLQSVQPPPPARPESQIPLWEHHKLATPQNAATAVPTPSPHSLWGHYDSALQLPNQALPTAAQLSAHGQLNSHAQLTSHAQINSHAHLNSHVQLPSHPQLSASTRAPQVPTPAQLPAVHDNETLLRQELLKQYQLSLANAPGTPSLLNHTSPSPSLYPPQHGYSPTTSHLLLSRINQLKLQQIESEQQHRPYQQEHAASLQSSYPNYSHLLAQAQAGPTAAKQLQYDMLAKADSQALLKYEQLLNNNTQLLGNSALLSHLQSNTLTEFAKSIANSTLGTGASTQKDIYNNANIWQTQQQDPWSIPNGNLLGRQTNSTDGMECIQQLLHQYDRNLSLLDDSEDLQ